MRDYELTLVLDGDLSSEKQKSQLEKIKKIINDLGGKVKKTVEWGKKQLAYPIFFVGSLSGQKDKQATSKKTTGYYFLWEISLPAPEVINFTKKIKLEEGVLRYLLVKLTKPNKKVGKGGGKNGATVAQ